MRLSLIDYLRNKNWSIPFTAILSNAYYKGVLHGDILGNIKKVCEEKELYNKQDPHNIYFEVVIKEAVIDGIKEWEKYMGIYNRINWEENKHRIFVIKQ